jgi:hypothetical protein
VSAAAKRSAARASTARAAPEAARAASAESRAETAKLARLLGLDGPGGLSYLYGVPARDIAEYREAVIEALYSEGGEQLRRAADAARLLPARVLAKVGELALGPLVCARLTGMIDPSRAGEIAEHFAVEFLARLAAELDPRRAVEVVSAMPRDLIVAVALEMASQGEQVAMGRFVAHLDQSTLRDCIDGLGDEDVLRVAFVAEGSKPHSRMFDAAGVRRMRAVLDAAPAAGLAEEACFFVERLNASQRARLAG